jgi:hypothetical protein
LAGRQGGAVVGLEALLIGDSREFVETQAVVLAQAHRLLGDVLEDLAAGKITYVAGVVVTHQQLRALPRHLMQPLYVLLGSRGGLDRIAPVATE